MGKIIPYKPRKFFPRGPRPDLAERNRQNAIHGHARDTGNTPTYDSWLAMKWRCLKPQAREYPIYGGRGITICQRWIESFEAFLEDMGERPPNTSIERIDVNGNYEPSNCKWATSKEQGNNKRTSKWVTLRGRTQTLAQWAEELGMSRQAFRHRVNAGWNEDQILDLPLDHANKPLEKAA